MGWPEEPTEWGAPGHQKKGSEDEAIRVQVRRLSGPVGGNRYTSGASLAAGIAGTESLANMDSGTLFLEAGRMYVIRVKIRCLATALDPYLFRLRKDSLAGTQLDEWRYVEQNTSFGARQYFESDYIPTADEETNIILSCQRMSGAGNITITAGGTTSPTFVKVHHDGHSSDVTTNS